MEKDKLFDDLARMASSATGTMFDFKREMEAMIAAQMEKFLSRMNLVTREEFNAVRDIARKAREENETLTERLDQLEKALENTLPQKLTPAKKPSASSKTTRKKP